MRDNFDELQTQLYTVIDSIDKRTTNTRVDLDVLKQNMESQMSTLKQIVYVTCATLGVCYAILLVYLTK